MDNITTQSLAFGDNGYQFDRYEFVYESPEEAIPCLIILVIASLVGTFGNVLILTSVAKNSYLQNMESIFIVNLAMSDMYVTAFADPMSIVAKVEGYKFFDSAPYLCQIVAYLCTMSCINSLGTIALLSFNRYIHICHHEYYHKIFKKHTCIIFCVSLYLVGLFLVLLNQAGIGDHSFDHKSLECIWERMATYPYTVAFSITLVWIPIIVIGFSYLNVYRVVRRSRNRTFKDKAESHKAAKKKSHQLFKALIIIYVVFAVCWIPYALIIVVDYNDTFSHTAHVYITMWAHLHPSINWLVYYRTHRKFNKAFNDLLHLDKCIGSRDGKSAVPSSSSVPSSGPMASTSFSNTASLEKTLEQEQYKEEVEISTYSVNN